MICAKTVKVLLIEGEADSALCIIDILNRSICTDFEIVHKTSMMNTLECIEHEKNIDIILLDLILPNSKGIKTFETLKNLKDCDGIPVVIISDFSDIGIEAVKRGAQDFIPKKNITLDLLIRSMRYAIERNKNEKRLEKIQERLRMALDATSDGIWDYDIKNNHIYLSNRYEEQLGYEKDSLSGNGIETLLDIMHPDDRKRVIKQNIVFLNNKESSTYNDNVYKDEFRLKDANGNYRWFLVRSMAISNDDNIPLRIVGVLVDITDRKNMENIREKSFNNLTNMLEKKLDQWNNDHNILKIEQEKKLNKITELIGIHR